ncbi:DUF6049 family protein [Microbacterium sp. NPDC091313]
MPLTAVIALLAVTLLTTALAFAGGTAADAAETPTPSPSTSASAAPALTLAPGNGGILRPDSALTVSAVLSGATGADVPVTLELGGGALTDRGALDAWLGGEGTAELAVVGTATIGASAAGQEGVASITVPADDPALTGRGPGVYPLRLTAVIAGEALVSTSVVVVPDDAVTATVGLVVPIVAPARGSGVIDAQTLASLTAADGELTAQLDAVDGTGAILAVDPAIPAAIRVLGTAAPQSAIAWLARLNALPNSRFALQYGDADLATQVQAGLTTPLSPTSLVTYESDRTLPVTPSPSPSVSAAPGADTMPDLAQLLDIGPATQAGVFWPATGTAGSDVVAALGAASASPTLTLVPSDTTSAGTGTTRARATAGGSQLLVYDSAISSALQGAAAADAPTRGADLSAASAYLSLAARDAGGQPLLVTVDRGTAGDRTSLRAAIQDVANAPGVTLTDLSTLAAAEPDTLEVAAIEPDTGRAADLTQLMSDEASLETFATILDDPALLTGRERAEILQLLAVSWRADAAGSAAALNAHREQTRTTLDAVSILPTSTLNLISYDAVFAPWIRNDLPWPVHVTLVAQPNDPRLIVGQRTDVVASADSNTRASINVQSRVGNGTVRVTMQLYSPTGVPIGDVQSANVEVRAEWETIGLTILISLVVLFVGLGVFRTVRRRRARRAAPATLDPELLEPDVRTDIDPEKTE